MGRLLVGIALWKMFLCILVIVLLIWAATWMMRNNRPG